MVASQESKCISSLKVFFCFLIILLHAHYQMPDADSVSDVGGFAYEVQNFVRNYFSTFLCCIAIPGFAIISGYLFFATADFSKATYKKKIQNRVFSLLIPYVVWNLIVFLGDVALAVCGKINLINTMKWNFFNVLDVFWGIKVGGAGSCPYNGPLWYIRDLFILCLLTPVIYPLLKSRFFKYIFAVVFFVALFVDIPYVYYHERIFTVYFCLGAFFAVNQIRLFSYNSCVKRVLLLGGGIANMLYIINYFGWVDSSVIPLKQVFVFCTLLALPPIALKYLQNERIVGLASSTFFIYCMHNSFLAVLGPFVKGNCSIMYLAYYLLLPVLDFITGYVLYLCVKKINNPVMNLLLLGKQPRK